MTINLGAEMHQKAKTADKAWLDYLGAKTAFDIAEMAYNTAHKRREDTEREWRRLRAEADDARIKYEAQISKWEAERDGHISNE